MARPDEDFGARPSGASAPGAEEPRWALAWATAPLPRLARGVVATVDLDDPAVRRKLASGLLEPLPAFMQPRIETGPDGRPRLAADEPEWAPQPIEPEGAGS